MECFSAEEGSEENSGGLHHFSDKFMELLIKVVKEKKDRFHLKTLVHLIWSFAKSPKLTDNSEVVELLIELRDYERLR